MNDKLITRNRETVNQVLNLHTVELPTTFRPVEHYWIYRDTFSRAYKGDANSQYWAGVIYHEDCGPSYRDPNEALKWYSLAAKQGHAGAQQSLGRMYENGNVVAQDYQKAMEWYLLAAGNGDVEAKFRIGQMYAYGHGVPEDHNEAMKWYLLAVEERDSSAQFIFGEMYHYGHGVPQDFDEAVKWLYLAAKQGHDEAQATLRNQYGAVEYALPEENDEEVK